MLEHVTPLALVRTGTAGDPTSLRRDTRAALDNAWAQAVAPASLRRMRAWWTGDAPAIDLEITVEPPDAATLALTFRADSAAQLDLMRHLTLVVLSEELWLGFQALLRSHGWALAEAAALLDAASATPALLQDRAKMGVLDGPRVAWVLPEPQEEPLAALDPALLAAVRSATGCGCGVCGMLPGIRAVRCAPLVDRAATLRLGGLAGNRMLGRLAEVTYAPTDLAAFGRAVVDARPGPALLAIVEALALRTFEEAGGGLDEPVATPPGAPDRLPAVLAAIHEIWDDEDAFLDIGAAVGRWAAAATLGGALPEWALARPAAGPTQLVLACRSRDADAVRAWLAFILPARGPIDDLGLVHAAVRGTDPPSSGDPAPVLDDLLALGAQVDECGADGRTPLMAAALRGDADLVRLLLDRYGADADRVDRAGWTALDLAAHAWAPDAPDRTGVLHHLAAASTPQRRDRALRRVKHEEAGRILAGAGMGIDGGGW